MRYSSISSERDLVSPEPACFDTWSLVRCFAASHIETSVLFASGGKASVFSSLVFIWANPVDSSVSSDCFVAGVDKHYFEEFEGSVLACPVWAEHSHVSAFSANSFLGDGSDGSVGLELVDTLVYGLSVDASLSCWLLSASSSDPDSIDDISLFGFVSQFSCLVKSAGPVDFVDGWELSVFPSSHSQNESEDIGLLLSPQFFKILVCSHFLLII